MVIDNTRSINANPTKKFFIDMLVRDIALEPAIAELVDNSLDGARKFRKMHENENYQIEVKFNKDWFSIVDTCGGITIEDARNYCLDSVAMQIGRLTLKMAQVSSELV